MGYFKNYSEKDSVISVFFMGLFNGENIMDLNNLGLLINAVIRRVCVRDMDPVNDASTS